MDNRSCQDTAMCRTIALLILRGIVNMQPTATRIRPSAKERLEARISRSQKALLLEAAKLQGRSLTDFIILAASQEAQRVVQSHRIIRLSADEQKTFVKAILSPPKPGARLRAAAGRYRKVMGK